MQILKMWGKQAENEALWTNSDIKVVWSLFWIRKSNTLGIWCLCQKNLEAAWVRKIIPFQIKLRPYITLYMWYFCLNQQNLKMLELHSSVLLKSISRMFLQHLDMIIYRIVFEDLNILQLSFTCNYLLSTEKFETENHLCLILKNLIGQVIIQLISFRGFTLRGIIL